jgi:hypothetical protein
MNFLLRFTMCVAIIFLSACGIQGQPLSPSEVKQTEKKQSLFPLNNDNNSDAVQKKNTKNYVPTAELQQIGYEYSANFGVENDNLDDVFERIKPVSSLRKKRIVIPLGRE